jgi:hypothetical protein
MSAPISKLWLKGALILKFISRDLVIPVCQNWTYWTWCFHLKRRILKIDNFKKQLSLIHFFKTDENRECGVWPKNKLKIMLDFFLVLYINQVRFSSVPLTEAACIYC